MMPRSVLCAKFLGLPVMLMLLFAGCGGGNAYSGPLGQVSGKVTFEGKPIPEGSTVVFQGAKESYMATGKTNANGEYTLKYEDSPNLPAVAYQVQIIAPAKASSNTFDPADEAKIVVSTEASAFPAKYSSPSKDFGFTVKEGKNTADFVLTK